MSQNAPLPQFTPSVTAAFKSVVESPEWVMNLVWLTIAVFASSFFGLGLIPILGWCNELIVLRSGRPEYENQDIVADRFGDYLEKGLWPFAVYFVSGLGLAMLMSIPYVLFMVTLAAIGNGNDALSVLVVGCFAFVILFMSLFIYLLLVPVVLRAIVTQDFASAFDLRWSINFLKLMFGVLIIKGLIFWLFSTALSMVGILFCFVGVYPASGWTMGAGMHLLAQIYECYLSRGGEPIPAKLDPSVVDAQAI